MSLWDFRLTVVVQALENDTYLAEALFFPEVLRYGDDARRLLSSARENASRIVEAMPLRMLYASRRAGALSLGEVRVELDAPPKSLAWREPVRLRFDVVRWSHGEHAHIGFIPALGIEVVARREGELDKLIPAHIKAHLLRTKAASSLGKLIWQQRRESVSLEESSFAAMIRSPKQLARETPKEARKSALEESATELKPLTLAEAYETQELVARMAETLAGRIPRSILLVGPSGVGKTAAVHELVRRRGSFGLPRARFWTTSGSRLIAGMSGFGMWQQRCGRLWREAKEMNAVVHLGNLVELMEVGKNPSSSQGIAGYFRPHLARGDFLAIVECTAEQLPAVERSDPHLLNVFHQITVEEPSREKGRRILSRFIQSVSQRREVITAGGLDTLDLLHRRYATYSAYPGRPLRFLRNLLQDREDDKPVDVDEVTRAFSRETGLPLFLLSDSVKFDLDAAQSWFRERVIGQPEIVDIVVDLLAMVKAGLTRPRKPIASMLFIGPTGVGKTEMAKSLAEFLFGDRDRMARFDMSEYADPISVSRLVGGVFGAEGLLTARVREQPFAVILLDEFEKAHPLFFDLLLQVLGEGRLTDAAGRVADFSNSVVIMTSNLGAESFRTRLVGFSKDTGDREKAREHFTREVRAFVRPELFNRIDRIVPFAPLDEETVLKIARRELDHLAERDGLRFRRVRVNASDEVAGYLATRGYDERYGARPLKRAIERELLVPLADGLNSYGSDLALVADVDLEKRALRVSVRPEVTSAGKPVPALAADAGLFEMATRCRALRCDIQKLERSAAALVLRNEIFRLERIEKSLLKGRLKRAPAWAGYERLPELRRVSDELKSASEKVYGLEDELLLALYGRAAFERERLTGELERATGAWRELLLSVYAVRFNRPHYITLAVYSENTRSLFDLARAYYNDVIASGGEVDVVHFQADQIPGKGSDKTGHIEILGRRVVHRRVEKPKDFLSTPAAGVVGVVLSISGRFAQLRYAPERGLHQFTEEKQTNKCLVDTSEVHVREYRAPADIERRGSIAHQEKRRTYDHDQFTVEDSTLKRKYYLPSRSIDAVLGTAIDERLMRDATELLESGEGAEAG